jgi:CRISPR-associated endonuclease/helicase Cas3
VRPFPVQSAAVAAALAMPAPGLLIIEAPMGDGKTEAALLAVEVLAARSGAGGCFFALPTRATSNAIFKRALAWLQRLFDADIGRGPHDVALVHGKASLNTDYTALFRAPLPDTIGIDAGGAETAAHSWFAGRKRKMLTSFAVGTIDQVLFAALQSKHLVLRHLGLAGKVVVVDEAHAYDVYMSRYLDRALHWLGAHGAPVIVLSATLPGQRRADMLRAYDEGRLGRSRGDTAHDPYQEVRSDRRYPLLTHSGAGCTPVGMTCAGSGRQAQVGVELHADDFEQLAQTLFDSLVDGGCLLVVCNTVRRVQQVASVLRERLGNQVTVAHSRYIAPDREEKDRWLVDTFGSPGHVAEAGRQRPERHVVVASQVAEQSLDIDFDLLVTDLAPVDLMLQRMGRLHRHARDHRPVRVARPRCLLIGADWQAEPPVPDRGSAAVYGPSALLRGAAVLWDRLAQGEPLTLPDDISPLVQAAYGDDPVGPPAWQEVLDQEKVKADRIAQRKRERADAFRLPPVCDESLVGWLAAQVGNTESAGGNDARGRAHVRDDGGETVEVIVLVRRGDDLVIPPWLPDGGVVVPTHVAPPTRLARRAAQCTLGLPGVIAGGQGLDQVIGELEQRNRYPAWEKDPWLGGELVLDLDEDRRADLAGFHLVYDIQDGLLVERAGRQ